MDNVIIGRHDESQLLKEICTSPHAEFFALYGRRRVGKTFLVKAFAHQQNAFFMKATGIQKGTFDEQIDAFISSLSQTFYQEAQLQRPDTWFKAFAMLHKAIDSALPLNKKAIIFLDELPWMATRKSRLLEALEYYWNQHWSDDPRIKLVICGSSASWIIRKIINNKGGLHNRITRKLHLKPFNLKETRAFLKHRGIHLNDKHITEIYMATGGVPYYLEAIRNSHSASQAIDALAFHENSLLLSEFDNLLSSLFENAEAHIELLRIIGKKRYGIRQSDILRQTKLCANGGTAVRKLEELIQAGFIIRFKSHTQQRKGIYYRLIDEYTHFYFTWIEPLRHTLQSQAMEPGYWLRMRDSASWHAWAGYAFEAICYQHLPQIRKALDLDPTALPNTWWKQAAKGDTSSGAQIDLLFDRRDDAITVCEIKFTQKPYALDKAAATNLQNKVAIFNKHTKNRKQIFLALISASGIKPTMYSEELISHVVVLSDLFK